MPSADDTGAGPDLRIAAATAGCIAGTIAFAIYTRTLLPGMDLGDTGGFQAAVLWPETSARQGYPLYYLLARPFVLVFSASNPARGLNLFSALCAGMAVGLLAYLAGVVVRSALAGAAAGLTLAFSYTFWTQAVIAEVYALHLLLIGVCLVALEAYGRRPATARLVAFFAAYAISFGNHLGMILLLVPFTMFLLRVHPRPRELLRPRVAGIAVFVALAGALLYLPNLLFVWTHIDAPATWSGRLAAFWFDVTKADWREAMVLGVSPDEAGGRIAMWTWDARHQVGAAGLVVAIAGALRLWSLSRSWAILVWTAYAISVAFAITYNVGDPHVFFLPGHFFMAFAVAAAVAPVGRRAARAVPAGVAAAAVILYCGWRAWDTWPAADRHRDRRADVLVARLAAGVDDTNAVLLSRMDWQSENALLYSARYERRDLAWTRLADVLPHLPFFIRDNHAIGRDIVLTAGAARDVFAAYGPSYPLLRDAVPPALAFSASIARIPPGTPYVLSLLTPTSTEPLDVDDFEQGLTNLMGNGVPARQPGRYEVWAGRAGEAPSHYRSSDTPFRESFPLLGDRFTVRLDSWLPFDTFRRGGFGHVLRGGDHLLTIERGASLVWFAAGGAVTNAYSGNLYAPTPRFRIPAAAPQQVAAAPGAILGRATPPR